MADWSRVAATGIVAAVTPLVLAGLFRLARRQKPYQDQDAIVFPTCIGIRLLGLLVLLMGSAFLLAGGLGYAEDWDYTMNGISAGFVLLGLLIYFMIGEVRLGPMGIEKRVLWMRNSLLWEEIQGLEREPGEWGDWVVTTSSEKKFKMSIWYASMDRLLGEIQQRAPALRVSN